MPGKDRCWQCGAALPPPEEAVQSVARVPSRRTGPPLLLVGCALLALLVAGGVMALMIRRAAVRGVVRRIEERRMMRERSSQSPDGFSLDQDPAEQRARQELQRLQGQAGYTPAPVDASGNIPLATGGSLSEEQYRKALSAIGKR